MPRADIGNISLYYDQRGVGPPLLCIPGALGTGITDFAPQLEGLSSHFTVIAPDLRGYGQSRPPDRSFSPDFLEADARDMARFMSVLGHERFFVAGWSDGANVGALLAITNPQRVIKLVMWGGNSYISEEDVTRIESVRPLSAWSERMRRQMEAVYGDGLQSLWHSYCDITQANFSAGGEICRQRLHLIVCPTLILHGENDPIVPSFHPHLFHEHVENSQLYIFPEGKHNIHVAYADEFNRVVLRFLLES
jgi:valacyclovir hydrolase